MPTLSLALTIVLASCSSNGASPNTKRNSTTATTATTVMPTATLPAPPSAPTTQPVGAKDYVLDGYSTTPATAEAQDAAFKFRDDVIASVKRHGWTTPAALTKAGYQSLALDPEHWVNTNYINDGVQFDPNKPEFFVVNGGEVPGVMFLAPKIGYDVPTPPGDPFIRWHRHLWKAPVCLAGGLIIASEPVDGACPAGQVPSRISPGMFHVWLGEMADPFTSDMSAHHHH